MLIPIFVESEDTGFSRVVDSKNKEQILLVISELLDEDVVKVQIIKESKKTAESPVGGAQCCQSGNVN